MLFEIDVSSIKVEGQQLQPMQQLQQKSVEDSHEATTVNAGGYGRSFTSEDDLKNSYTFDVPVRTY